VTPFDKLWAGDLLDQAGSDPSDHVIDLAGIAGRGGGSIPFCVRSR
jgi:hypothetical protein